MMKKFLWLLPLLFAVFCFGRTVSAADVDYSIESYRGYLTVNGDNTASYTEEVVYQFDSAYNGQFVTLGSAGKMPDGFLIDSNPKVEVTGARESSRPEITRMADGYEVKIYNGGDAGDRVTVVIEWHLTNIFFVHDDILELNWTPISDWDQGIGQVELTVEPNFASGQEESDFHAHTGYLARQPEVEKLSGGSYRASLDGLGSGEKLELHAYWSREGLGAIAMGGQSTGETALPAFRKTESSIAFRGQLLKSLFRWVLPLLAAVLLLLSLICYRLFRRSVKPRQSYPKNARLYEIPQDLAPLVVASNIYSVELDEVNPTESNQSALRFENMVQATLLDLVDRGNLTLQSAGKSPLVRYQHDRGLSEFEQEFLRMAMGKQTELSVADLFSDYQISDSLYKGRGRSDESHIRSVGSQLKNRFDIALTGISDAVGREIKRLSLQDNYRSLTGKEKGMMAGAIGLSVMATLVSLAAFLIPLIFYGSFLPVCLLLILIGGGIAFKFMAENIRVQRDGVLNEDGALNYYHWHSFENMLRQISNLDQTEVDGLILWNRLLVYATLYGCADKVSKVMKLRQIRLENPSMDAFVYYGWNNALFHSAAAFAGYGRTASTASNFSVSSSGSSGGGFSGGGGGGGGGAF